ncbi:MAG: hypothetical protein ABIP95_01645 [Pelobium sp.]
MYLNNFQTFAFGSILIFILCFAACEKSTITPDALSFGEKAVLKPNEATYFGSTPENAFKLTIQEISDSRCPEGVNCVWAGEAVVKLSIKNLTDSVAFALKISPSKNSLPDTLDFNIEKQTYRAILYGVNPYPEIKNKESSIATVTLLKK